MGAWKRFVLRYAVHFAVAFVGMAAIQAVAPWIVTVIAISFIVGGAVPSFYLMPRLFFEARKAWRAGKAPVAQAPPPSTVA